MNMFSDLLFKAKRSIIPVLRGGVIRLCTICYNHISINGLIRVGKNAELVTHPGCYINIEKGMSIGNGTLISVLPKGNLVVGEDVGIGSNCQVVCHNRIVIGDNTILGPNVMIFDHNHKYNLEAGVKHRAFDVGEITIGKSCWLGAGCIILKDVHIGDYSIIAAGSVVTKDVPSGAVVAGIPAKIIKSV